MPTGAGMVLIPNTDVYGDARAPKVIMGDATAACTPHPRPSPPTGASRRRWIRSPTILDADRVVQAIRVDELRWLPVTDHY